MKESLKASAAFGWILRIDCLNALPYQRFTQALCTTGHRCFGEIRQVVSILEAIISMSSQENNKCFNSENLSQDSRKHSFSVSIAIDHSPVMAIWLDYLANRIENNLSLKKHIHEGLCWIYDTLDALCEKFPYFNRRQIEHLINNSIKAGLVVKGNYNHTSYDRTVWYALTPKAYFYYQHLITQKNLTTLYLSISQNCEMDFTEFVNGFHKIVTTIPITDPFADPIKKSEGETPASHTIIKKFPTPKERNEKAAYESEIIKKFFETKFSGLTVTYDEIFKACKEHYGSKRLWVTPNKWKSWLEREKLDNYSKKSTAPLAPIEETEVQRNERQYFTYQLIKEKEDPEYISKDLQKHPEMREKYAQYAR